MRRLAVLLVLAAAAPALARKPSRYTGSGSQEELPALSGPLEYQFAQVNRADIGGGRTRVSVESGQATPRGGYFPMRFFVDNTLGPRQVLTLGMRGNAGRGSASVSRAVEIAEGERRVVTLPVPVELRYGMATARGPGVTERGTSNVYFTATSGSQRALLSLGRPEAFERFAGRAPSYSGADVYVSAIAPQEAPTELAALIGYDGVILPEAGTFEELSEAQRRALEAYAAAGGTLTMKGPLRAQSQLPLLEGPPRANQRYGFGRLLVVDQDGPLASAFTQTQLVVSPQGPPPEWERRYGGNVWDMLLPQATAPLGRFLLIIFLFTLAIGPGSLFIAKRRGPAALLVTIPAIALATCAVIVGYSLVADGFTVHGAVHGYTLLDRKQNRAITAGVTAYYANLAPGRAEFSSTVAVVGPFAERREHHVADVTWQDGARFGADFVPSRSYREWGFVAVEPTRARMVLRKRGDGWAVQNALGADVDVVEVNLDGVVYEAKELRDGGEKALERARPPELASEAGRADNRLASPVRAAVMEEKLKHAQFLARLDGQGFVPTGGLRLQLHEGDHFVRGEVEQ